MTDNAAQGKHAADAQTEGIGKDAHGNTVLWTADAEGGWTPVELKKKRHPGRVVAIVCGVLLLLAGSVYAGGWWYFHNHLFPNTTMAGTDLSYKTSEELIQLANSLGENYTMVIEGEGVRFTSSAKDVAAGVNGEAVAAKVITNEAALRWPLELQKDHDISDIVLEEFRAGRFEADLRQQILKYNESATDPENAYIEYDAEAKVYAIHPEVPGTKLQAEPIIEAAGKALLTMESHVTIPEGALIQAEILSTDKRLTDAVEQANNYCKANFDLVLGTTEIYAATVDASQVSQWVSINDKYEVAFDEDAMNAWIEDFAYSLDTVGTERTYVRPSDGAEYLVSGGTYGWEIDSAALIEQIRTGIMEGQQGAVTVSTITEGYTWNGIGQPDWGAFADVDLSQQHARFFNTAGECVWESDFISGAPDGKHDTTPGVWRVLYKESPSVLRGEMTTSGTREYETQVKYWMQFTYSGIGFHDATWQWAFGGNSYAVGYGSHGCINLPYDAAERLFGLIEAGNAVIVHW